MSIRLAKHFLQLESASGILLLMAAVFSLILANSPWAFIHQKFVDSFLFVVNEGLMTLFFLIVGLELKRSYLEGSLTCLSQVMLPLVAAIGGMMVPALIYVWINYPDLATLRGWATPVATDIAFALGVLSLFGSRVPIELRLFLMALAIFDDIGAIIIIAFFYSTGISILFLFLTMVMILILVCLNYFSVKDLFPYLVIGILLWLGLLGSGIHPTVSGVLLALTIPGNSQGNGSPMNQLEAFLHPWVAYFIMPVFAFANAGFSIRELSWDEMTSAVVWGIALGLFFGKQIGVFLFSAVLILLKFARLPDQSTWLLFYGVTVLCGIGFTMSLFLGTLSFTNQSTYLAEVRLGVVIGSLLSGLLGGIVILFATASRSADLASNKQLKEFCH